MNKKKSKSIIKRVVSLFFVFLFFLFGQHVFISWTNAAMDEVWIIRQDAVNASTCNTTSRICSSLASWEDTADGAGSRDLVTEDKTVTARIEGNWTSPDTTAVAISGWTTDATHYIRIYTAPEARHSGKWETNKYILSTGLFGTAVINNSQAYTRIEGLQIQHSGSGGSAAGIYSVGNAGVVVKDSLVRKSSAIVGEGIKVTGTSVASSFIINSVAYGGWDIGIDVAVFGGYGYAYNTTSYGNNYGYRGFYIQNLKNCIGASNTTSDFSRQSSYAVNTTTCASSDATATSFTDTGSRINQTFSFVDSANGDFHLAVSDVGAKDFGTDLSADIKYAFSTDIDGQARSGSWDIGADEYTSGVADTTNPSLPTGLAGTAVSTSQINLSWTASTDNVSVAGYKIYRDGAQIATTATNSYSNTGLSASTAYSYAVEAYDGSGNVSGQSSSISVTTQAVVVDTTSPTTPTSFTATPASSSQINLSWTASTDNVAVTGYKIYKNGTQINTTTTTSYSDTGLSASTAYSYAVSAYDAMGNNSSQTTAVSATTQAVSQVTIPSTISGAPVLNFSDLTSGPKTGLGDGLGSGAIVTIWGTNLGSSQGTSKVYVGDVEAAYVYDWADATPHLGHPADLYTYHKMQTIAFSVPATAVDGANTIKVVVNGVTSNTLPFTVRAGNIFWVKGTGSNSTGNGSWSNPWATFGYSAGASEKSAVTAGAIIYGVNVTEISSVAVRAKDGTASNPIAMVGYPLGYLKIRKGGLGIWGIPDRAEYWVFSKWDIVSDGDGITPTNWGRVVGNSVTDSGGTVPRVDCADGSASAINGGDLDGTKIYGNYVHDFGCYNTSNQHHTTYFSRRNKGYHGEPFDLGWNYFADNQARGGIHIYDEHDCWGFTTATPVLIHDNVSINQVSIAFGSQAWICDAGRTIAGNFDIFNNLFINAGLKGLNNSESVIIQLQGDGVTGHYRFYNNTIYGYGFSGSIGSQFAINVVTGLTGSQSNRNFAGTWEWKNNIIVDTNNFNYTGTIKAPTASSNNIWYNGGDGSPSAPPSWDISPIILNPLFSNISTNDFRLQQTSPAVDAGTNLLATLAKDILGVSRPQGSSFDIGAYEYNVGSPSTPQPTLPDTTPNSFAFTSQTNIALNTLTTSNTITISGIDSPAPISISGGTNSAYSINGGTYTSASGTVTNGQTVTVRQTSSSSNNIQTSTTLNIGGVTSIFNITTIPLPADTTAPTNPTITINSNDSLTNNSSAILTLSAIDNTAVTQMKFSADNLSWTTAEAYATTKNWSLLGVDGLKTVYVQFGDASNNWSAVASDTITLDTTAPTINTPTITNLTTSTATISFTTTESANTAINYGLTSSYGNNQIITPTTARSTTHTITLSSLNDNTTYNYQLTANDLANNQNSSTNLTFTTTKAIVVDTTTPSAITNLNINNIGTNSLTLSWTATGDDNTTGTASSYNLRYSTKEIVADSVIPTSNQITFTQATALSGLPTPQTAGTLQSYDVIALAPNTLYYFALQTIDDSNNISNLSNIVYSLTSPIPVIADTIAPAEISTLTASNISQSSVFLSWTATGDDNNLGTASSYDLRYLKDQNITAQNWSSATQITIGEPTPTASGIIQSMSINQTNSNLAPNSTYYFAIKTYDEVPNISNLSNIVKVTTLPIPVVVDTTAPAMISTLQSSAPTATTINLSWTAVGDDNNLGTATSYDLRYSTSNITQTNFNQATQVASEPTPKVNGTTQSLTVTNLNPNTFYYFAIKAIDEAGNISTLSNITTNKTAIGLIITPPSTPTSTTGGGGDNNLGTADTTPPKPISINTLKPQGAKNQTLLSWQNPTDNDFIRTTILRRTNKEFTPTELAQKPEQLTGTSINTDTKIIYQGTAVQYTDINLQDNTKYYYAFYTVDRSGNYSTGIQTSVTTTQGTSFNTTTTTTTTTEVKKPEIKKTEITTPTKPEIKKLTNQKINLDLSKKLAGKILLQVEQQGRAYYVNPDNLKRHYLGRPQDAFNLMRKLGLGVKHGIIANHETYYGRLLGKILLDVEEHGEAYYINPKDKKKYYLGRPADAFRIMREQALGITDNDLEQIEEE